MGLMAICSEFWRGEGKSRARAVRSERRELASPLTDVSGHRRMCEEITAKLSIDLLALIVDWTALQVCQRCVWIWLHSIALFLLLRRSGNQDDRRTLLFKTLSAKGKSVRFSHTCIMDTKITHASSKPSSLYHIIRS